MESSETAEKGGVGGKGGSDKSGSSGRRTPGRRRTIGRPAKGTKKSSNTPKRIQQQGDLESAEPGVEDVGECSTSEPSLAGVSEFSVSIMSESIVETSEWSNETSSSPKTKKKKSKSIGRQFKSTQKAATSASSISESILETPAENMEIQEDQQEKQQENQGESSEIGLWNTLNYILGPPDALQAPSERSLAVEEEVENIVIEAVNEEFSADVSLLEDVQPSLEDVAEFEPVEPQVTAPEDDTFLESPYVCIPVLDPSASDVPLVNNSELTVEQILRLNLLLLLPTDWSIDISKETLRLTHLSPYEIPVVEKAITWKKGVIKIFVHNLEVPKDNFIWSAAKINDPSNMGEVCDRLCGLASLLLSSFVCEGVQTYQLHWKRKPGFVVEKNFQENSCLRHPECSLLMIASKVCYSCNKLKSNLKNIAWRKKLKKDKKSGNNRYMNREELLKKACHLQAENRKKEKTIAKLRERVKRLVARESISVAKDLSDDLATVFAENNSSMSEVQKLFWSEQVKAMAKGKNVRTIRWNPFVIKLALHLQMISPAGYKYMKNFIKLPSERTLYDYTHVVEAKEGVQDFMIADLKKELESKPREEHEKFFNCLFDEISVRSDIVLKKSTGEIIGYTNLTSFESEMAAVEAQISETEFKLKPATKCLVYMVQGVTNEMRGIVAIYPTESLTAAQLFTRTWNVIYHLESNNLKIISLICDGAPTNKKFFRMHALNKVKKNQKKEVVFKTVNLAAAGEVRYIFFIVDPPHLLKSLRNCLANSYSHKGSKRMWKNNEDLSWKVIEAVYNITLEDKFKSTKLTRAHVYLTSYSCMKVVYAAQVASNSVVAAIHRLKSDPRLANYDVEELCHFLLLTNNFFDCLNGAKDDSSARNRDNKFLAPYEDENDWRFDYLQNTVLKFFHDWRQDVDKRKGKFKQEERDKMFISNESYESLEVTINGFIGATKYILSLGAPYVEGRRFNQDKLEQYFGVLRMAGGGNDNPSVMDVIQKSVSVHQQGKAAQPSVKGNTEVAASSWIPDQRPLAKRGKYE